MIKQEGDKYCLYDDEGNKVATYDTREEAEAAATNRTAEGYRALLASVTFEPRVLAYEGEHPFTYCMEHVVPAMEREGKAPQDPKAFCGWWKEEHYTYAEAHPTMRHLHLVGCAERARIEKSEGREYIVVPVVALMEGVIHAVNADHPEFVPLQTLRDAAKSWEGKPVTLGHPVKNGKQCSADSLDVRASHGIGIVRNSRVEGKRLLQEAWIDKQRVKELHPAMHDRLLNAKQEEVSVGAYVVTDKTAGQFDGRNYKAGWRSALGDHLAFLPGGRGACSIEMGCGAYRAASHFVTGEQLMTLEDVITALVGARHSAPDNKMIQAIHDYAMNLGASCDRGNYETLTGPMVEDAQVVGERKKKRVRNEGGRWVLYSTDGTRRLSIHDTENEAWEQERAVEIARQKRSRELQETH